MRQVDGGKATVLIRGDLPTRRENPSNPGRKTGLKRQESAEAVVPERCAPIGEGLNAKARCRCDKFAGRATKAE